MKSPVGSNLTDSISACVHVGVFILVAGGLAFSCVCIWVEIIYKKKMDARQRQLDLARVAVAHWRGTVKVRNNSTSKNQVCTRGLP